MPRFLIWEGLTYAQALAYVQHPNANSKTCTTSDCTQRTKLNGPWFDRMESEAKPYITSKRRALNHKLYPDLCPAPIISGPRGPYQRKRQ